MSSRMWVYLKRLLPPQLHLESIISKKIPNTEELLTKLSIIANRSMASTDAGKSCTKSSANGDKKQEKKEDEKKEKKPLADKNIVLLGSYGGIGFATAHAMICAGLERIVMMDVKDDCQKRGQLKGLNENLKLDFVKLEAAGGRKAIEPALIKAKELCNGRIDVIINSVGVIKENDPDHTVALDLMCPIWTSLIGIDLMGKHKGGKGGKIITLASVWGLEPGPVLCIHSAAKHGVVGLNRSLGVDHYLKHTNVTHITICPGATKVEGGRKRKPMTNMGTFEYTEPLMKEVANVVTQPALACGEHIVQLMDSAENGSVWISDIGELTEVEFDTYWCPTMKAKNKQKKDKPKKEEKKKGGEEDEYCKPKKLECKSAEEDK